MDNPPLVLFPPEYSGGNFFKKISRTVCVNATQFDIYYWSVVSNTADDTLPRIILHEFDNSLFKCLINTKDYNTRKYLLNSVVSDYVHPTIDEVIKIVNCNNDDLPPHILEQIDSVIRYCCKFYYTSFSDAFLNISSNNFNVFDIFKNDVDEYHHNYKIVIPNNESAPITYFYKALLVHKSLIDIIDRG